MPPLRFAEGERVRANHRIVDESGWDPGYRIEPGDAGTIRSLGGPGRPSEREFGVEWDGRPGEINAVHPDRLDPA